MRNSSVTDLDNEDGGHISVDSILRTMAYCVIFILGLVGNVFVLYALKQKKRRRTANDWFILNLTISDILLIMCIPADVYLEVGNFPYNIFFCKVQRPLSTLVYFVSIFTITAMALERHQVITKPFQPKMEQQRAFLVVGGIWVLALVFIVPLPIVTSAGANECEEHWSSINKKLYAAIIAVFQYLLPLAIITAAYIYIVIYLWNEGGSQQALNIQGNISLRAARKDNIQVVKAVIMVVIFFAVCMLPSQLAWLLWEFGKVRHKDAAKHLLKFAPITSYLHSCANPIIYGTFMAFFRKEFKLRLAKCFSCCHGFICVLRRGKIHRLQVSSSHREARQQYYNGKDNNDIISANSETRRGRDGSAIVIRKEILETEIGAQRNFGFMKEEREENESETHL